MKRLSSQLSNESAKKILIGSVTVLFTALIFIVLWGYGSFNPTKIDISTSNGMAHKLSCCAGIAILLGVLVWLLSREFLHDEGRCSEKPNWYYPLLAGLLSFGGMFVAYSFVGMWPFGEKTGMIVDMHHQYAPLLAGLRESILNLSNPLYTFEAGLGTNYLSMFGYYLASPLNLLLVLFPERFLAEGILFITLIKNALCGAFFALCVQKIFGKKNLCIPIVAVMYSLMMYLLAYSWNIMWLDVVFMLPIVVLGFERLMHTGKFLTYVLSLAYCLYANYYIAFMLCIFLVFYYVAYVLRSKRTLQEVAISLGRFAGFSLLSAGLVAALIIPVYLALSHTSAAGADLPSLNSTLDVFQMLGRHLANTSPTIRSGNLPNIYCGVLTAMCLPLFALNKGIAPRHRVVYMAFWLVMLFSFLLNLTDLAWHGLHSPNDLPYRFSFLYSFLILLMAYETLSHLKEIEPKHVLATFAGLLVYLVVEERFGDTVYGFDVIYINLILIAVYTLILLLAAYKKLVQRIAYALLLLVVTMEMAIGGGNTLLTLNSNEYFTKHADYVDNVTVEAIRQAVEKAEELGDNAANGDFYRLEVLPRRTCVDTSLFHYRGITLFSSSNYYSTTKLMGGLGYAINGVNSHLYRSFVPFTDSILGIRYVVLNVKLTTHPQLKLIDSVSYNDVSYYIYENTDALGVGYVANPDIKDYTYSRYDPITSQNDLAGALAGIDSSLYTVYPLDVQNSSTGSVPNPSTGFHLYPKEDNTSATFTTTVTDGGQLFLFADCNAAKSITVVCGANEWSVTPHEPYIIDGGVVEPGTQVTVTVSAENSCTGHFYAATLNESVYHNVLSSLSDNQLVISDFGDNYLTGSIDAKQSGVLMTSIPYDAGWKVKVDGKAVSTYGISDAFLAFDIESGTHTVELVFIPDGLWIGLGISFVSMLILIVLLVNARRNKPKSTFMAECLDLETAMPIQEGFSIKTEPLDAPPPIPDTLEELTDEGTEIPPDGVC